MVVARRPTGNHDAPAAIKRIGANAMADIFISYTAADRDWAFWIAKELEALGHTPHVHEWEIERGERHLCLDGAAPRHRRPRALRRVGRLPEGALLHAGTQRRTMAGGFEPAGLRAAGRGQALPAADAQTTSAAASLRRAGGRGPHPFPRIHGEARGAGGRRVPWQGVRRLQHPDPRADAFPGPRRRARRHRDRARALRGPRRHHRAARAARRRQDHARGGLCRAAPRRLPRHLVDQGADRARHARRSRRRSGVRLGWVARRREGGAGARRP